MNWRSLSVHALRAWIVQQPDRPKYLIYRRKHELIHWIEQHAGDRLP